MGEWLPAAQGVHTVALAEDEYDPAGHAWHALAEEAPAMGEWLPAAQGVHAEGFAAPAMGE